MSVQVSIIAKKGSTMGGFAAIDNIEFKTSQQGIIGCATLPEVVGNISPYKFVCQKKFPSDILCPL